MRSCNGYGNPTGDPLADPDIDARIRDLKACIEDLIEEFQKDQNNENNILIDIGCRGGPGIVACFQALNGKVLIIALDTFSDKKTNATKKKCEETLNKYKIISASNPDNSFNFNKDVIVNLLKMNYCKFPWDKLKDKKIFGILCTEGNYYAISALLRDLVEQRNSLKKNCFVLISWRRKNTKLMTIKMEIEHFRRNHSDSYKFYKIDEIPSCKSENNIERDGIIIVKRN